jgi:hypothetical protein
VAFCQNVRDNRNGTIRLRSGDLNASRHGEEHKETSAKMGMRHPKARWDLEVAERGDGEGKERG